MTETEAPVFWSSDAHRQLIGKVPDAGKDQGQEKKASEDEMGGWHHRFNGQEFEQTLGNSKGQEAWHAAVHGVAKRWTRLCEQQQESSL